MLFVLGKQLERINEGKKPSKDISGRKRAFGQSHVASKTALGNGEQASSAGQLDLRDLVDSSSDMNTSRSEEGHEKAFMRRVGKDAFMTEKNGQEPGSNGRLYRQGNINSQAATLRCRTVYGL